MDSGHDLPSFKKVEISDLIKKTDDEISRVVIPAHKTSALKKNWTKIYTPLVTQLKLQVRVNLQSRHVEIKRSPSTKEASSMQKATDFVKAFLMGFEVEDALALIRLDDLYVESFNVYDVRMLKGAHKIRAVGRVTGIGGKTKFAIENSTRTRMVIAGTNIHILGSFMNIKVARDAICDLILGSQPGKVHGALKLKASRVSERY